MSLLSAMIAVGISVLTLFTLGSGLANGFKAQRQVELRGDLEAIRRQIVTGIDCAATLRNQPTNCSFVDIRRRDDASGAPRFVMRREPAAKGAFAGSGRVAGEWYARARCGRESLVVEVARKLNGSWEPAKDPLTGTSQGFDAKPNPLFGDGQQALRLCAEHFDGTATAPTRIEAGNPVEGDVCVPAGSQAQFGATPGTVERGVFCAGNWVRRVRFAKPFTKVPNVVVSAARLHGSVPSPPTGVGACDSRGGDGFMAVAERVTRTGFDLVCIVSPLGACAAPWPRYDGWANKGSCSWVAIGEDAG